MDVVYQCKAPPQTHRAGAVQVYHYSHYYIVQKFDADHRAGAVSSSNLVFYAQSTSVVTSGRRRCSSSNLVFYAQSTSVVISGRRRCKSVPLFSLLHSSKPGSGRQNIHSP